MAQEKRNPIFSVDVQIRFRGAIYEVSLARLLKWLVTFAIIGFRARHWNGDGG